MDLYKFHYKFPIGSLLKFYNEEVKPTIVEWQGIDLDKDNKDYGIDYAKGFKIHMVPYEEKTLPNLVAKKFADELKLNCKRIFFYLNYYLLIQIKIFFLRNGT